MTLQPCCAERNDLLQMAFDLSAPFCVIFWFKQLGLLPCK